MSLGRHFESCGDIKNVKIQISNLDQQKNESVALLNALTGAKQQCDSFLQIIDNVEPEVSDSSDVGLEGIL